MEIVAKIRLLPEDQAEVERRLEAEHQRYRQHLGRELTEHELQALRKYTGKAILDHLRAVLAP